MGGKSTSTSEPKLNQIKVQTSAYGIAVGRGWGTFRASCNLLYYTDFQAIPHTTTTSTGGKGGGGKSSNTTYTYTASIILGVCAGPVAGVRTVYRDKSVFSGDGGVALSQAGLSLANGSIGQPVWGYLSGSHPAEAIGYSGLAYAYAANYALSNGAGLPNHSFEVEMGSRAVINGVTVDDALPSTVIGEFLSEVPLWPAGLVGDLGDHALYCTAANLLVSPYLDSQRSASDFLTEILTASNSDAVWSDGVFKVVPYGDVAVSGNGVVWSPRLTPVYDLSEADFVPSSDGEDPVKVSLKEPADCYNYVQVEFLDRSHQYNTNVVPGIDQASIDAYGVRKANPATLHSICDPGIAAQIAQIMVQRSCYVRQTFTFQLADNYCLLEPMVDVVTITSGDLNRQLVRITEIAEAGDGLLQVTAEEVLVGSASAPQFSRQSAAGPAPNYDISPGAAVNVVLINPPGALLNGTLYEAWLAVAGGPNWGGCEVWASLDGTNYERQGVVNGPARFGTISNALPSRADPDVIDTLAVDVTPSNGVLLGASQADADAFATLCLVDGELISYRDASLVSAHHYSLGYLRRGVYGTGVASHAPGAVFVRLDQGIWKFPYQKGQVGRTLHLKFRSFNVFGRALQDLSAVADYTITLNPNAAPETPLHWSNILGPGKPEDGADVTANHTAGGIIGQGPLATSPLTPAQVDNTQGGFAPRFTWNFNVSADGFTASGAALTSTGNGTMVYAPTTTDNWLVTQPFIYNGTDVYIVRMRVRPLTAVANWSGTIYWGTASYIPIDGTRSISVPQPSFTTGQWFTLEWDISGDARYLNQSVRQLRIDLTKNTLTQWEIDWVSIGKRAADQVKFRGIQDNADPTGQNTAAAIAGQGQLATSTLTTVQVDNRNVPVGANALINDGWSNGQYGWTNGDNGNTGNSGEGGLNYPGYGGQRNVMYRHVTGNVAAGKSFWGPYSWGAVGPVGNQPRYALPVVAGDLVYVRCLMANHRCRGGLGVRWMDGSGAGLGDQFIWPNLTGGEAGGPNASNGDPANFAEVWSYFIAPAGAKWAALLVYVNVPTATADPFIFVTEPMLAKAPPGQNTSVKVPYLPGTVDRYADQTGINQSASIAGQGALATKNQAGSADLAVGIGANLLWGSDHQLDPSLLYRVGWNPANASYLIKRSADYYGASWSVADRSTFTLSQQDNTTNGGSAYNVVDVYALRPDGTGGSTINFAVQAGKYYEWSFYVTSWSQVACWAVIVWYDANGGQVGSGSYSNPYSGNTGAGRDLNVDYFRIVVRAQAPTGAAYAVPLLRKQNYPGGSWMMWTRPKFCETVANATETSPWSPSAWGVGVYQSAQGRIVNANGLPINGMTSYGWVINPTAPLSSPSSTSINVAPFTLYLPGYSLSVSSQPINGLAPNTAYSVYWDLQASTFIAISSGTQPYSTSPDRYIALGVQTTQQPSGGWSPPSPPIGGGGGGGGGICVLADSHMPNGIRAGAVQAGTALTVLKRDGSGHEPEVCYSNRPGAQPCVMLTLANGAQVGCTVKTPIEQRDGSAIFAQHALGAEAAYLVDGVFGWAEIVAVEDIGVQPIAQIAVGNRSYAAGVKPGAFVFTHNQSQIP